MTRADDPEEQIHRALREAMRQGLIRPRERNSAMTKCRCEDMKDQIERLSLYLDKLEEASRALLVWTDTMASPFPTPDEAVALRAVLDGKVGQPADPQADALAKVGWSKR